MTDYAENAEELFGGGECVLPRNVAICPECGGEIHVDWANQHKQDWILPAWPTMPLSRGPGKTTTCRTYTSKARGNPCGMPYGNGSTKSDKPNVPNNSVITRKPNTKPT